MARKKANFNDVNADVFDVAEQATAETENKPGQQQTTPDETLLLINELLKGNTKKSLRVNLIFTPENYAYCKVMSQVRGQSLNEFLNHIIKLSSEQHKETFDKAVEFLKSF